MKVKSLLQRFPIGDQITCGMVRPKVVFEIVFVEHIHSCKEYVGLVKLSLKVGKWKLLFLCVLSGCVPNCFERTTLVFNISDIEDLNGSLVPTIRRNMNYGRK